MEYNETMFLKWGNDVRVHSTAIINHPEMISIGNHVSIDIGVYIATQVDMGNWIHIAPYVCVIGGEDSLLTMEDFAAISAGAKAICASDDFTRGLLAPFVPIRYRQVKGAPIHFKKFSALGANSIIMPGVTLAEGSTVGALSVVTKDTEPWGVYVGSPAKRVGTRDRELILKGADELQG